MRSWYFWWQSLVLSSQQNPPRFIEAVMLSLAIALLSFLFFAWQGAEQWPYLVLSLSYGIGASTSILVRETQGRRWTLTPTIATMVLALAVLILGLCLAIADVLAMP